MTELAVTFDEADLFVKTAGNEEHLARRVEQERQRLGLSQEGLSRAMANVGCPLHQSAISKIEHPGPAGRRSITINEAIALAKVFDVPLAELLLPAKLLRSLKSVRDMREGPEALLALDESAERLDGIVSRLAAWCRADEGQRATVEKIAALESEAAEQDGSGPAVAAKARFFAMVLDAASQQQQPPAPARKRGGKR